MVSFDNTEIAFSGRSDKELTRAYWLFKLVGNPTLVKVGKALLTTALKLKLPVKRLIRSTVFNHFCGGETIAECDGTIGRLHEARVCALLDYSSEGKESEAELDQCANEIIAANNAGRTDERIPFSVFKPTAIFPNRLLAKKNIGSSFSEKEQKAWENAVSRMNRICQTASENGVPILVDAEESWFQHAIDELVEEQMRLHNRERAMVFNTIQLYRKDRLRFLKDSFAKAQQNGYKLGVKLVRGAYMEKERERANDQGYPSPIHETKEDTDRDYDLALEFCIENHPHLEVLAGTHNEISALKLSELMTKKGLNAADGNVFFSQLYGMSDNISFNLAASGFNVVKYVPYGPVTDVMPYLIRRAEENTSISGQTGRELSLIIKERNRRRGS